MLTEFPGHFVSVGRVLLIGDTEIQMACGDGQAFSEIAKPISPEVLQSFSSFVYFGEFRGAKSVHFLLMGHGLSMKFRDALLTYTMTLPDLPIMREADAFAGKWGLLKSVFVPKD